MKRVIRPYIDCGDHVKVVLTHGKVALLSKEDVYLVEHHNWNLHNRGYARRNTQIGARFVCYLLHRAVMGDIPEGMEVDHINGDRLDCRRSNLRLVTRSQNHMNMNFRPGKTGVRGVVHGVNGTFSAQIKVDQKAITRQCRTLEEAIRVRAELEREYFGEFRAKPERLAIAPPPVVYPNPKQKPKRKRHV